MNRPAEVGVSLDHADDDGLLVALRDVLAKHLGPSAARLEIIDRCPNQRTSTFPTEIVTCRAGDGTTSRVFCKYSNSEVNHAFGHRSGVVFEAMVYEHILGSLPLSLPRYLGQHPMKDGRVVIALEALDEFAIIHKVPEPDAMILGARWIGRFHAINEVKIDQFADCLHIYDAGYYRGWCQRTTKFAGHWHQTFPWLTTVCERFQQNVPELLTKPDTIIHGEFYPKNILLQHGKIFPVDWESAAIAPGVIDFASMTENWPDDLANRCEQAYCQARWPSGHPHTFESARDAARLYLQFRWLGDREDWTAKQTCRWRFEQMKESAERMGLI